MQDSQRSYICKYLCMFFCRQEGKHTVACLLLCFILEVNQQLKIHWFKLVRLNDWLICCFILDISKPLNFALFQNKSWFCIIGSFRLICFFRTSTFLFICSAIFYCSLFRLYSFEHNYQGIVSHLFGQVFIHGNSLKSSVVGIVVPDPDAVVSWCAARGVRGSYKSICASREANQLILKDMQNVGRKGGLKTFEMVGKIIGFYKLRRLFCEDLV